MKKYPKNLYYIGSTSLLQKTKISIVGSKSPSQYARHCIGSVQDSGACKINCVNPPVSL